MTEKPILCNAQTVRNFLEGRQTQDRRPIKPPIPSSATRALKSKLSSEWKFFSEPIPTVAHAVTDWIESPYFPGDHIYVRETWADLRPYNGIAYKADISRGIVTKWSPSIHMPKWAARLWLEVTGVRVERVQDISEEDCLKEGIDVDGDAYQEGEMMVSAGSHVAPERYAFITLWNQLYPDSWHFNDWVFVYDLKKLDR